MSEFTNKKKRIRRSPIWAPSKEELQKIVNSASSYGDVLGYFGLRNKGGNARTLKERISIDNIDISLLQKARRAKNLERLLVDKASPIENILIENSSHNRNHLKKRILKEGLLKNQCAICGQLPEWNGKPLSLQLDHINGISNDNRLENLRILCPHCHSQTDNFAGKNKSNRKRKPSEVNSDWRKVPRIRKRKALRPTKEELQKLLWEKPTLQLAKQFGVSDKAVEKWAKQYGLNKPPRGYWQKR